MQPPRPISLGAGRSVSLGFEPFRHAKTGAKPGCVVVMASHGSDTFGIAHVAQNCPKASILRRCEPVRELPDMRYFPAFNQKKADCAGVMANDVRADLIERSPTIIDAGRHQQAMIPKGAKAPFNVPSINRGINLKG